MAAETKPTLQEMLDDLRDEIDPAVFARELREYRRDAQYLSSQYLHLVEQYDGEFIAVYRKRVRAHAPALTSLIQQLKEQGIRPGRTAIEFIERNPLPLIV